MQQRHHHGAHRKVRFLPWSRLLSWQGTIFSLCSKSSPLLPPAAGSVSQQEHEPLALLSTAEPGLHLLAGRGGAQTLFELCSPWIGVGSRHGIRRGSCPAPSPAPAAFPAQSGTPPAPASMETSAPGLAEPWRASPGIHRNPSEPVILAILCSQRL